jgi:IS30 family transposase
MIKYKRITFEERVKIELLLEQRKSKAEISRTLDRHKSSITREVNRWVQNPRDKYKAQLAHFYAEDELKGHRTGNKILSNNILKYYIHLQLKKRWSPEQISKRLKKLFPNDKAMQVSHESIYTYIYIWAKGELRKELIGYLRQKKSKRKKPENKRGLRTKIPDRVDISERPPEVKGRLIPGHWESDLIIGKDNKSAIGSIVERTTRTLILVKLKDRDAATVRKAFAEELKTLPEQMRLSMTHDNGMEMAQHKLFTKETQIKVYFAHPYSPWQRGTNENTNMLIRDFFPKGTDFNTIPSGKIKHVQDLLNERPRKILDWRTPKEVFDEFILQKC